MKRLGLAFICLLSVLAPASQEVQEEAVVINVEVPVRVFRGDRFINNLTIEDFEVFENGVPQRLEAVYLVKKRTIERSEEKKRFSPETTRHFYLFFEISSYTAEIDKAVEYFVQNVLYPGDNLTIITPARTYNLRGKALEVISREKIAGQLKGLLWKDILKASSEYRSLMADLKGLVRALTSIIDAEELGRTQLDRETQLQYEGTTPDIQLMKYEDILAQLDSLRRIDQKVLLDFSRVLKYKEGQKSVFIFYQRESVPKIETRILEYYQGIYQDNPNVMQSVSNLFEFYRRDIDFDVDVVKQNYADASISINFLFLTTPILPISGIKIEEQSEDIYASFREMAAATGGFTDSSANANYLFHRAVEASENYYLLYYSPRAYARDGRFKNIRVAVKDEFDYRVYHRQGYFAN